MLLLLTPHGSEADAGTPDQVEVVLEHQGRIYVVPAISGANGRIVIQSDDLTQVATQSVLIPGNDRVADAVAEFEDLLNHRLSTEADFQSLVERHPAILLGSDFAHLHPHVVLRRDDEEDLIPDFLLEPIEGMTHEPQIVDLKLPWADVIKPTPRREGLYASVMDGINQLRTYGDYFREKSNREYVRKQLGFTAYRPQLVLIVGKSIEASPEVRARVFGAVEPIQLRTYEDLLRRLKAQAAQRQSGPSQQP